MNRRVVVAAGLAAYMAVSCRPARSLSLAGSTWCRPSDSLVKSARGWLSSPDSPADTVGKNPGGLPGLPALGRDRITEVRDEPTCRAIALALARARRDSAAYPVGALAFGPERLVAWDFRESGGPIFVVYYVLDRRYRVLSRTPT
jgi:hypothetical protein